MPTMRQVRVLAAVIVLSVIAAGAGERVAYAIKVAHLGANAVGITCLNGGDPTGATVNGVLIISCGGGK